MLSWALLLAPGFMREREQKPATICDLPESVIGSET